MVCYVGGVTFLARMVTDRKGNALTLIITTVFVEGDAVIELLLNF